MASSNTRITDLEPVNMDDKDESLDNPSFVHNDKLVEIVHNGDNYRVLLGKIRETIVGSIYPVGSIYQSTEPDNPAKVLGMPNSVWRLYGDSPGSNNGKGAPAALYGVDDDDYRFTLSETIRGVDALSIMDGYIKPYANNHWGWKRLRISNFSSHHHSVESADSNWVWKNKEKSTNANPVWDTVESIDFGIRAGYGILTSLPPVISSIIEKRNLGTTTTNILSDPRVNKIKVNGKTVEVDTNGRQFVSYNNVTYIYTTVAQMKSKNKDGTWAINGGTTNVSKWLPDQTSNQSHTLDQNKYLGEVPIPSTNTKTTGLKNPAYSPVANPITKSNTIRIKANNSAGYTDISNFTVGSWVNYTDSEGNITQIVFSKDYDVREKDKTVDVKVVNKWIPYHEVWQNKYWGRANTNIDITTADGKVKPGLTLSQEKDNSDVTLGYYGTASSKKITAHAGDIIAYKYKEFIYNPIESAYVVPEPSKTSANEFDIVKITQNEWAREDTGVDIMTKLPDGTPSDYDVGQDYPRNSVRNEYEENYFPFISEITVSNNGYDSKKWDTGGTLRLVGNDVLAWVYSGYGIVLWPDEVIGYPKSLLNSLATMFRQLDDIYRMSHSQSQMSHADAYSLINTIRAEIQDATRTGHAIKKTTKSAYYPEGVKEQRNVLTGEVQNRDEVSSWRAYNVDNWDTVRGSTPEEQSHTLGTIVNTLPPYVTAYRWVRIS